MYVLLITWKPSSTPMASPAASVGHTTTRVIGFNPPCTTPRLKQSAYFFLLPSTADVPSSVVVTLTKPRGGSSSSAANTMSDIAATQRRAW